jgi:hypothetical protein
MAYGTKITGDFEKAQAEAIARHSHYYDPPFWLFRVDAVSYAYVVDRDGDVWGSTDPVLEVQAYPVLRETPRGATLSNIWSGAKPKWVDLRAGAKQWASRSVAEAVAQFAERRRRQVYVLNRQLRRAEQERDLAERALLQSPLAGPLEIV